MPKASVEINSQIFSMCRIDKMKLVTIFNVPPKSSLTNNVFKDSVDKVFFLFFYLF